MVNNIINATYTETYDLNTAIGELSILGIHTPLGSALRKMYKGMFEQYKKFKILGCNLQMVCATQQALTPDLVGLEAGSVDPRDVLNPILFKACTGENLNVLLNQVYNTSQEINTYNSSLAQHIDTRTVAADAYYQLLADNSWRKSHPQSGLTVMGLKPMVHKVVTTQPLAWGGESSARISGNSNPDQATYAYGFGGNSGTNANDSSLVRNHTYFVSDGITDMPWLDTTYEGHKFYKAPAGSEPEVVSKNAGVMSSVPRVYCGCIVLPPAILQRLFFRMQIVWHIQFKDFRPAFEVGPLTSDGLDCDLDTPVALVNPNGPTTYFNVYHSATDENLSKSFSSFDANGLSEVTTINESVR